MTMRTLFHGSAERIVSPQFGFGKRNNDCGIGFHAYYKSYLTPAKKSLGRMLDFACNEMKFEAGEFWDMFLRSGVADRFGSGESRLLAGMSGIELAYEVLDRCGARYRRVREPVCSPDKSPEYWLHARRAPEGVVRTRAERHHDHRFHGCDRKLTVGMKIRARGPKAVLAR